MLFQCPFANLAAFVDHGFKSQDQPAESEHRHGVMQRARQQLVETLSPHFELFP